MLKLAENQPKTPLFRLDELRLDAPESDFALHEHRNPAVVVREPDEDAAIGIEDAVTVEHGFHLDRIHRTDGCLERLAPVDQHLQFVALLAAHRRKARCVPDGQGHRPHVVERRHDAMFHALDSDRGIGGALDLAGLHVGKHRVGEPRLLALAVEPDDGSIVERALVEVLAEDFGHESLVAHAGIDRIVHGVDARDGAVALREREELRLASGERLHLEGRRARGNRAPTETEGQTFSLHPRGLDFRQVRFAGERRRHEERREKDDRQ